MRKLKLIVGTIFQVPQRLFSKISIFALIDKSTIHSTGAVLFGSKVYWSEVGRYTFIGRNCFIIHSRIGNFCSIANNVIIGSGKHPLNFVSTSPVFYSDNNILKKSFNKVDFEEYEKTTIGSDVWIGSNAFVKGGVTIGHGAVIGAHSVVTKDIEPYSIVAGNPARLIRKRFDDIIIQKLIESEWWNFSDKILNEMSVHFNQIDEFLRFLDSKRKDI